MAVEHSRRGTLKTLFPELSSGGGGIARSVAQRIASIIQVWTKVLVALPEKCIWPNIALRHLSGVYQT